MKEEKRVVLTFFFVTKSHINLYPS